MAALFFFGIFFLGLFWGLCFFSAIKEASKPVRLERFSLLMQQKYAILMQELQKRSGQKKGRFYKN